MLAQHIKSIRQIIELEKANFFCHSWLLQTGAIKVQFKQLELLFVKKAAISPPRKTKPRAQTALLFVNSIPCVVVEMARSVIASLEKFVGLKSFHVDMTFQYQNQPSINYRWCLCTSKGFLLLEKGPWHPSNYLLTILMHRASTFRTTIK